MAHFIHNEQRSFSPVHGLKEDTKKWIMEKGAAFNREAHHENEGKHLYEVDELFDAICRDMDAVDEGTDIGRTQEQLLEIRADINSIRDHGSQYGIDLIQLA